MKESISLFSFGRRVAVAARVWLLRVASNKEWRESLPPEMRATNCMFNVLIINWIYRSSKFIEYSRKLTEMNSCLSFCAIWSVFYFEEVTLLIWSYRQVVLPSVAKICSAKKLFWHFECCHDRYWDSCAHWDGRVDHYVSALFCLIYFWLQNGLFLFRWWVPPNFVLINADEVLVRMRNHLENREACKLDILLWNEGDCIVDTFFVTNIT